MSVGCSDGYLENMSQLDTLMVSPKVVSCFMFTNEERVMKYELFS